MILDLHHIIVRLHALGHRSVETAGHISKALVGLVEVAVNIVTVCQIVISGRVETLHRTESLQDVPRLGKMTCPQHRKGLTIFIKRSVGRIYTRIVNIFISCESVGAMMSEEEIVSRSQAGRECLRRSGIAFGKLSE